MANVDRTKMELARHMLSRGQEPEPVRAAGASQGWGPSVCEEKFIKYSRYRYIIITTA